MLRERLSPSLLAGILLCCVAIGCAERTATPQSAEDAEPATSHERVHWNEICMVDDEVLALTTAMRTISDPTAFQSGAVAPASLHRLKLAGGRLTSTWQTAVGLGYAMCLRPSGREVYLKDFAGKALRIDLSDGEVHWKAEVNLNTLPFLGVGPRSVFAITRDAKLLALDREDGRSEVVYEAGNAAAVVDVPLPPPDAGETNDSSGAPQTMEARPVQLIGPVMASGRAVLLDTSRAALLAFQDSDRHPLIWEYKKDAWNAQATIAAYGDMVVVAAGEIVTAVDARSGQLSWEMSLDAPRVASVRGSTRTCFIVGPAGPAEEADTLIGVDAKSGDEVLRYVARSPDGEPLQIDERLFADDEGVIAVQHAGRVDRSYRLVVLDRTTGEVVWGAALPGRRMGQGCQIVGAINGDVFVATRTHLAVVTPDGESRVFDEPPSP